MELKYRYYKKALIEMYNEGYSPIQMEKEIPVKVQTIKAWHKRLGLSVNKFNKEIDKKYHSKSFSSEEFIQAYNACKDDLSIANTLKISRRQVCKIRAELNLLPKKVSGRYKCDEKITLDRFGESALVGCLLGDGYLKKTSENHNTSGIIAHSVKQSKYIKHKHKLFSSISGSNLVKCTYTANRDKKHEGLRFNFLNNPYLDDFYDNLYVNDSKVISDYILNKYNDISLAYHFMDDGTKTKNGYSIGTYGFSLKCVKKLASKLRDEFKLKVTIRKDRTIYIKKTSVSDFNLLVSKYIIPSMQYKLHKRNGYLKQGEFMGTPEVDNHELSLSRNTPESATTRGRHVTDDAVVSNSSTSALPYSDSQISNRISDDIVCPTDITADSKDVETVEL